MKTLIITSKNQAGVKLSTKFNLSLINVLKFNHLGSNYSLLNGSLAKDLMIMKKSLLHYIIKTFLIKY